MIWEYERELTTGGFLSVEKLNEMGSQGWENYYVIGNVYFFKREKKEGERQAIATPAVNATRKYNKK